MHAEDAVAPVLAPYLPVPQLIQVMAPVLGPYVPALQAMHDAADVEAVLGLYVPALQLLHAWYGVGHASPRAAAHVTGQFDKSIT
jgi:hypothetical protein